MSRFRIYFTGMRALNASGICAECFSHSPTRGRSANWYCQVHTVLMCILNVCRWRRRAKVRKHAKERMRSFLTKFNDGVSPPPHPTLRPDPPTHPPCSYSVILCTCAYTCGRHAKARKHGRERMRIFQRNSMTEFSPPSTHRPASPPTTGSKYN